MFKTSAPVFLCCTTLLSAAPAIAAEAFVQQATFRQVANEMASRAASLLSNPIPLSQARALALPPVQNGAGQDQNSARIVQTGSQNQAVIAQQGAGNYALVTQRGQGNVAMVSQTARAR